MGADQPDVTHTPTQNLQLGFFDPVPSVMTIELIEGDCRAVLRELPNASIDSVVTDPPYALVSISKRFGKEGSAPAQFGRDGAYRRASAGFMGKAWDTGDVAHDPVFWADVLRVLKPGGHVLAFGGTRTYHRLACAIEDGGFEIRDQIGWVYGSGFPKSHNQHGDWEGWGTALKPAWEPIVMARRPLIGTVAANLSEHGTGALNIDGCRVDSDGDIRRIDTGEIARAAGVRVDADGDIRLDSKGRWPANLMHDGSDEVLAAFPTTTSGTFSGHRNKPKIKNTFGEFALADEKGHVGDSGSAARFFYCAKASRADRNDGLQDPGPQFQHGVTLRQIENTPTIGNTHPTVKPTELMRYLCRLVTPPGGTVLDPFMGSGSTGRGAVLEGFDFIGIEMDAGYFDIADARIAAAEQRSNPSRQAAE